MRENRKFAGFFQQDSGQQLGTGPLEYRVPVPKNTDCMVSLYNKNNTWTRMYYSCIRVAPLQGAAGPSGV
jgi:hypothetical protein